MVCFIFADVPINIIILYCLLLMNFHVADLDDIEALLREYDDNLVHRATADNMLGLVDASSLLWRLEVMARITKLIYLSRLVCYVVKSQCANI